jgi:hypothetical protein
MRISVADGGDHGRLDGVQAVLGLVEDDRGRGLEDLVGDLEGVETEGVVIWRPISVSLLWSAGRQCMNFTSGFPVAAMSASFTW